MAKRRICFVTGTRAEYGLMCPVLAAIEKRTDLELQIAATGMHLSMAHGRSINQIYADGWNVNARVLWPVTTSVSGLARSVGLLTARLANVFERLKTDIVLVAGDRVEAFAGATAGSVGGRVVAHVHGGDRALGQIDDSLRHAITKLSHVHLCATRASGDRVFALGEDRFRINVVGTPGVDGIREIARKHPHEPVDALIALHPESPSEQEEFRRASLLLAAVRKSGAKKIAIVNPNNDPGWRGIDRCWKKLSASEGVPFADLPRGRFLGLLANAGMLVGNSSAGIIEAASLGVRVVNVGDRQLGRERSENVTDVPWNAAAISRACRQIHGKGGFKRFAGSNVYGAGHAGGKIARILSDLAIDSKLMRKLIRY